MLYSTLDINTKYIFDIHVYLWSFLGNKLTLNEGNFDRIECSSTHYQPLQFFSFGNTNCTHLKSPCSEEGQVIEDNGTSYSDRSCRCDYRQGYAFVNDTSVHCSCMPSREECTCFQKPCRENEVLSPGEFNEFSSFSF